MLTLYQRLADANPNARNVVFFDEFFDLISVFIDDGDRMSLAGKVFQNGSAGGAKSNQNDLHKCKTAPFFITAHYTTVFRFCQQ